MDDSDETALKSEVFYQNHVKTVLKKEGLHKQLPKDHMILNMYGDSLKHSHPRQPEAVKNYVAIISSAFYYVSSEMENDNETATWVLFKNY